jgi:hypothetical protein
MSALVLLVIVGTTVWMGMDASGRDFSDNKFARATWQWVVGGLGLWIVAFPAYLVCRGRAPLKGAKFAVTSGADWSRPEAALGTQSRPSVPPPSAWIPPPDDRAA